MNKVVAKNVSELVDILNNIRVPLSSKQRETLAKIYPYYGAQGIVDYIDNYLFDGEYILIAEDGENLKSNNQNICNLVQGKFWVNNHAHIVRANANNSTKYLYYNFNRIKFEPYVTGSSQPKLNKENLLNIKAYVHENLNYQKSIAKVLYDLDSKIELNNRINLELEAIAKTLYDYWFVQFDFPNEQGKPYKSSGGKMVYNAELKREIPEGWEVKKLEKILIKFTDKSKHIESKNILNNGKYPVITQDNGDFISGFTYEENPIEDVPLIIFGDHSCTLRYIDFSFFRGADGTQIMKFGRDLAIYIYLFLQRIIEQIPGYGKYERHYKYLKEFDVIIPESQYLKNFQLILKPIFDRISHSHLQNQKLSSLRDWLLPMLMNGQVTVK